MTVELPLESPVLIVAVAMAVFLVAPLLFRRLGLPGTVGVLLAGTLLGPHGLGVLARSETIVLLGTVGILYLMFVAALEIDMGGFAEAPGRSVVFGLVSFGLPLAAGVAAGFLVFGYGLATSLLFASVFSSHTILAYPVIEKLGLGKSRAVTTAVSATLFTDTAALLVLAWAVGSEGTGGAGGEALRLLGGLVLLAAATWLLVPRIARWFFRRNEAESYFEFLFAMVVLFAGSALAELFGLEPLIGAFLAGLGLNRRVTAPSTLQNRIEFAGNALFIPFFLFSVGMLVDPSVFVGTGRTWLVGGLLIVLVAVFKFAASWLSGALYDFEPEETRTAFALTTGQAAAALAITLVGFDQGMFDATVVNGVVIMVAATAVVSPMLSERFGSALARRERRRQVAGEGHRRILVPILGGESHLENLVQLAMLLQEPGSEEPVRVVHVVERRTAGEAAPGGRDRGAADEGSGGGPGEATAESALVEAEAVLEEVEELGAGAEVPLDTQTRTDDDRVRGVIRAVEDSRISTLVTEWREPPRYGSRLLGSPVEELVRQTDELLLAARLPEALESVNRLVAVVPSALLTHPGLSGGLSAVRGLAARMDTPQRYLVVDGEGAALEAMLEATPPEAPFEVETLRGPVSGREGWPPEAAMEEGDAPVIILPRPGGPYASGEHEALPSLTEDPRTPNAILLFPAETARRPGRRHYLRFS